MILSVVIVNYNVKEFLEQCLNSTLKASEGIETEIFVVDNNSVDGSQSMLQAKFANLPQLHFIFNTVNFGFGKANNQALRLCRGKYILVLNPDTLLSEDTLQKMIAFMKTDETIGAAGCKLLNADGTFQLSCRRTFPSPEVSFYKIIGLSRLFPMSKRFARYNLTYLSTEETYEIDALMGAFIFLRREILESVGLFDETFFMYGEDLDWCYRMKQVGWKIFYYPGTQIIHYKGESAKKMSFNYVVQFYEAMLIFVRKYYHSSKWFEAILVFGIYARAILAVLRRIVETLKVPVFDALLIVGSLLIGFRYKFSIYPSLFLEIALPVYVVIWMFSLMMFGLYKEKENFSIKPIFPALLIGFGVASMLNFFFKDYAFSRVGISASYLLMNGLLVGWRILVRSFFLKSFSGVMPEPRRVAIVGTEDTSIDIAIKLKSEVAKNYQIVGFIKTSSSANNTAKLPIGSLLGSLENLNEIISINRVSEVIFVSDALSNSDVLSAMTKCNGRGDVEFKIVPQGLDLMIGKGTIDELTSTVPLAEVDYNLSRPARQQSKRLADIIVALPILIFSPFLWLFGHRHIFRSLGLVIVGRRTWVGAASSETEQTKSGIFIGKRGVWSLADLRKAQSSMAEQVDIYYAKNSSLGLDLEILMKSLFKPTK
jgi:O-antigen biosynthesis protein